MKLRAMDIGRCGVEQFLCAGKVSCKDAGIDKGIELCELPENIIITKVVAVVEEAFNAATTNVLTVGTNEEANDLLGEDAVTEGTVGEYMKDMFKIHKKAPVKINVKFASSGTEATKGKASIYLGVIRIPD